MKIYTKTGDRGETGLLGGVRVDKDHPRLEAIGTVDELNAVIGVARAEALPVEVDTVLSAIQHALFALGAELAMLHAADQTDAVLNDQHIGALEGAIDRFEQELPSLKQFILPSGTKAATALHHARAVCRRAERSVVALTKSASEPVSPRFVVYLNRLGDLLFVLARGAGQPDVPWEKP